MGRRARRSGCSRPGVALGTAELLAAVFGPGSSPIVAVGGAAVDASPEWLKSFAIRTFGEQDKLALLIGIGVVLTIAVAIVGAASVAAAAPRHRRVGGPRGDRRGRRRHPARERSDRRDPVDRGRRRGRRRPTGCSGRRPGLPTATAADDRAVASPAIRGYDRRRFLRAGVAAAGIAVGRRGSRPAAHEPRERRGTRERAATIPAPADRRSAAPGGRGPRRAGRGAVPHAERRLLPRRHGVVRARDRRRDVDAPGARDGRPRDHPRLRRTPRAPDDRARHHARLRLERGRRALRGERALDRRAARRPPPRGRRARRGVADRVPLGRRIHDRHADRRRDGRQGRDARGLDERRAAPARARVPGPDDRARSLRLRLGDEVAGRPRAHDARRLRRVLDPAGMGEGGAGQDAVEDRHARRRRAARARAASPWRASRGRSTEASNASRCGSTTAPGRRPSSGPRTPSTRGGSGSTGGTRRPGSHTLAVRATDGDGETQTADRAAPFPDGATGHHTILVEVS